MSQATISVTYHTGKYIGIACYSGAILNVVCIVLVLGFKKKSSIKVGAPDFQVHCMLLTIEKAMENHMMYTIHNKR